MSEIKEDPSSILLPIGQYATESEPKNTCIWEIEKNITYPGELCNRNVCLHSDEYCSAHLNLAKKRGIVGSVHYYNTPVNTPEVKLLTPFEDAFQRAKMAERLDVPQELVLTPQEIQRNVEQLKKLDLLNNMMDLLKISFK